MTRPTALEIMRQVAAGEIRPDDAVALLAPASEVGDYATIDLDRRRRCGFPEVVFSQGKTVEQVLGIVERIVSAGQDCLATRLDANQSNALKSRYPTAILDSTARTFRLMQGDEKPNLPGLALIVTAGTSDLPVAFEARETLFAFRARVELLADVGVAGLHRLLRHSAKLAEADVIITVAGMEGALPSVVGGLVDCPVIAVPTSVGYGASFQGLAALLTALNSCSAAVATVNIDAGFKAASVAATILRRMAKGRQEVSAD